MSRSDLALGFAPPKPLPKPPARSPVSEAAALRFENAKPANVGAEEPANDARLVVNMPEAMHRKIKLRACERGITIREYVLELLAADGLL